MSCSYGSTGALVRRLIASNGVSSPASSAILNLLKAHPMHIPEPDFAFKPLGPMQAPKAHQPNIAATQTATFGAQRQSASLGQHMKFQSFPSLPSTSLDTEVKCLRSSVVSAASHTPSSTSNTTKQSGTEICSEKGRSVESKMHHSAAFSQCLFQEPVTCSGSWTDSHVLVNCQNVPRLHGFGCSFDFTSIWQFCQEGLSEQEARV